jgi:hypothetical protein
MYEKPTTYRASRGINWSSLSAMRASPAAYHYRLTTPRESTPAMDLGRLIHSCVLEPDLVDEHYAVWEGGRRGTNEHKAWLAENVGKEATTAADMEKAQAIAAAVWSHKAARRVLRGGRVEVPLRWTDPVTHMLCKGRPDHIRGGALTDLKSTKSIEPRAFGRSVESFGMHAQMAFYRRGMDARGMRPGPVRLIAVEQEPPHEVAVYVLDDDVLYAGELLVNKLLAEVKLWRGRGRWPGRFEEETALDFPAWALAPETDYTTTEIQVI